MWSTARIASVDLLPKSRCVHQIPVTEVAGRALCDGRVETRDPRPPWHEVVEHARGRRRRGGCRCFAPPRSRRACRRTWVADCSAARRLARCPQAGCPWRTRHAPSRAPRGESGRIGQETSARPESRTMPGCARGLIRTSPAGSKLMCRLWSTSTPTPISGTPAEASAAPSLTGYTGLAVGCRW